jgi:hypothetical protein
MLEPKVYQAKLVDQISEKSKWALEAFDDKLGRLILRTDNRVLFIESATGNNFLTSELQADPCWRGDELILVTRNSTYVFEILGEVEAISA